MKRERKQVFIKAVGVKSWTAGTQGLGVVDRKPKRDQRTETGMGWLRQEPAVLV